MSTLGTLILIVDDNEGGRYSKSRMLRFAGFEVAEAKDGESTFQFIDQHLPSLILLDVNLPDVSGYEICRRLKANVRTSRIPVILTSAAFTKGVDRARGLDGGADGYLTEPIEPEVVHATISSILRAREAEDAALLATQQWEATFRSISEGIALIDHQGRILRCNERFRMLDQGEGSPAGSSTKTLLTRALAGEESLITLDRWLSVHGVEVPLKIYSLIHSHSPEARRSFELEMHGKWYQITIDPVIDHPNAEQQGGAVVIFTDITERRNSESSLIQARNAAETANAAKDRFLAVLSHELRTPLTPILMSVEGFLTDDTLDLELRAGLEMIRRNVELEARLIEDLLDLTRVVRGKMHLQSNVLDLEVLTRQAIEITMSEITDKQIQMTVTLNAGSTNVIGDAARLQQVLWNLIKNAVKFTPLGGNIEIYSSNPDPDSITIEVRDSGIGMSSDAVGRVFEPFEQANENITRKFGGLGLGLAIGKNIAELHKGTLKAFSAGEGEGSTFTLTLKTHTAVA
jgi:signal transduction histidine kinase